MASHRTRIGWVGAALISAVLATAGGCSSDKREPIAEQSRSALVGNSKFEIDGNAKPFTAGNKEWQTVIGTAGFTFARDLAKDANDESFGQGAKEDSLQPQIVNGSIPPNKNDFTRFYVYTEVNATDGHLYFAFAWFRTNDTGTSNQDVELNRVPPTEEGVGTPQHRLVTHRSAGDVLITFDTHANNPALVDIGLAIWGSPSGTRGCIASNTAPCWLGEKVGSQFKPIDLGTFAEGAVNGGDIDDVTQTSAGGTGGTIGARRFGEANVDLTAAGVVDPNKCAALSSAFLKSRSSDSFSAELKDYVPPIPLNLGNCTINLNKTDDTGTALAGATFGLYLDANNDGICPDSDAVGTEKTTANEVKAGTPATHVQCTTNAAGTCATAMSVELFDKYCVYELSPPTGGGYAASKQGYPVELTAANRNVTVSSTIVNPRLFKIITFVCRQSDKTLYSSKITVDGTTISSLGTGALPAGLSESVLCDTLSTGAVFPNKQTGGHAGNDCIPLASGGNCTP